MNDQGIEVFRPQFAQALRAGWQSVRLMGAEQLAQGEGRN
jgi:hypothetical protein